jgi:hypothetical protein
MTWQALTLLFKTMTLTAKKKMLKPWIPHPSMVKKKAWKISQVCPRAPQPHQRQKKFPQHLLQDHLCPIQVFQKAGRWTSGNGTVKNGWTSNSELT